MMQDEEVEGQVVQDDQADEDAPPTMSLEELDAVPSSSALAAPPDLARSFSAPAAAAAASKTVDGPETETDVDVLVFGFPARTHAHLIFSALAQSAAVSLLPSPATTSGDASDRNFINVRFERASEAAASVRRNGEVISGFMVGFRYADPALHQAFLASLNPSIPHAQRILPLAASQTLGRPLSVMQGSAFRPAPSRTEASHVKGTNDRWTGAVDRYALDADPSQANAENEPGPGVFKRAADLIFGW